MAILKDNTITAPYVPSKEARLNMAVNQIKSMSAETFNTLINTQRRGIDLMWHNETLNPQEIIDALDDDAFKVFLLHGKLTELLLQLAQIDNVQVDIRLPTNAFSVDQVGKITVSEDPYTG